MLAVQFETLIESAVAEVLESMCFLFIDADAAIDRDAEACWVSRRLDFSGPRKGSFGIRVPLHTARVIACNLLGQEQGELSDAQSSEAVGEVANMVCGTMLCRFDSEKTFDLTSPVDDEGPFERAADINRATRTFLLEEGLLVAWLEIGQR